MAAVAATFWWSARLAIAAGVLLLCGCATRASIGEPLQRVADARGYHFAAAPAERHDDETLMVVTFSGGGTRAAAVAYGVLEQLKGDQIQHDGIRKPLLDEIDLISAVSGGSVLATYFALYGDATFDTFRRDFLEHDVQADLWLALLASPANWLKLASSAYSRGDMFADYLDRRLFRKKSFADLMDGGSRPFLVLNATDLSAGGRFEFTQDWFDAICVDLARFRLARAVAASSAYPIMVTPIAIRNRAGDCGYRPPDWAEQALHDRAASREAMLATRLMAYQRPDRIRYLHLADGALADNLGVRTAIDVLSGAPDAEAVKSRLGVPSTKRIVLITVNATGNLGEKIARRRRAPGIFQLGKLSGSVLIDQYANENKLILRELLERLGRADAARAAESGQSQLYWIDVDLASLADAGLRDRLLGITTSYSVAPELVAQLICSGHQLLAASVEYRRLVSDMGGTEPAAQRCGSRQ